MDYKIPEGTGTHRERYKGRYGTPVEIAYNVGYDLCETWIFNTKLTPDMLDALDPLEAFGKALAQASLTQMSEEEKLVFDVGFLDAWSDAGGRVEPVREPGKYGF